MDRFQPIFKYYSFPPGEKIVVEVDPQDGSDWPFHFLVLCEKNPATGQWNLYQNEWVPLTQTLQSSDLQSQKEVIKAACLQLVARLNESAD